MEGRRMIGKAFFHDQIRRCPTMKDIIYRDQDPPMSALALSGIGKTGRGGKSRRCCGSSQETMKRTEDNMSKVLRYGFLLAVAGCLLLAQPLMAADGIKGNLVNVRWLEKNLRMPDVLILDASPAQIYTAKHIPGAISVDLFSWYGLQEMPVADMEKLYQSWGISSGKKIVMYDQGGTMLATRLFFSLYYYGFPAKDLFILDGGLSKWQEAGLPVTKDITPAPKKGSFTIKKVNEDVRVRLPEFLTASGDPVNNALLEALGADWHFGEVAAFQQGRPYPQCHPAAQCRLLQSGQDLQISGRNKENADLFGHQA